SDFEAARSQKIFSALKSRYHTPLELNRDEFKYDLFISYSRQNTPDAKRIIGCLKADNPEIRIFYDLMELDYGSSWQQQIFETLDFCRKVVPLYSPPYLLSKVCKDEFNIGLCRHRESKEGVLIPIYLYNAALPTYMKLTQYMDCREGDRERLREACRNIAIQCQDAG
ncbi:MAG: toll/interleukin-1 receptor domain-containing protein, partial [Candidatus Aminicenantes bacterium]|nr:toll/interleukin-1 receptor domain-containing protein [Candidatus Aminicenantes bacterium]